MLAPFPGPHTHLPRRQNPIPPNSCAKVADIKVGGSDPPREGFLLFFFGKGDLGLKRSGSGAWEERTQRSRNRDRDGLGGMYVR
jgi:hypothetical protein